MKVIMIKDLKKVGKRGEIVEISDGSVLTTATKTPRASPC